MISAVAILALMLAVQYALIRQAAFALSETAYRGARYASIDEAATQSNVERSCGAFLRISFPTSLSATESANERMRSRRRVLSICN
jgi:hypothetical protein